ncbi:hypothetical protein OPV22_020005 [Ensete ventricosum]|uniref:Vacuolar protein 14 C-terminal Fig4-binding domain-containing protein n=1 Tax=Ensete ventricosum TaxID=4639 RepID=A0AAV8QP17_ENSVE|nr:hypothetical protein OPV22_020005 [Ensete ventricosum]
MAEASSLIPASVLRSLIDKLYEKRKNAAVTIQDIVGKLAYELEVKKILAVINILATEFSSHPQPDCRKGGLIGLAAVAVGLKEKAPAYLEEIVQPILHRIADEDSTVRYIASEALYNVAKTVRGDIISYLDKIFDALCKLSDDSDTSVQNGAQLLDNLLKDIVTESDQFSLEEFVPLVRERMNIIKPQVRLFLLGWITVLNNVPDMDMLYFLPDYLDGLFNMLSDSVYEVRHQAHYALSEFLQEIKNTPMNEFVKHGGDHLIPCYSDILGAVLPCISDKKEEIREIASETNKELRAIIASPAEGVNIRAVLSIAKSGLASQALTTRVEALHWIVTLLDRHRNEVISFLNDIFSSLLAALSDRSDEVVVLVLEVHACIAEDSQNFGLLIDLLVQNFRNDHALLEKRGAMIVRRLCARLDAEQIYREFSSKLEREDDLDFAALMVQAYNHASSVIQSLREEDITVKFSVQLDKLIGLLETPIFAFLRLQLVEPEKHIWLLKTLYGLLMLLPQRSAAFKIVRTRLKTVPSNIFNNEQLKHPCSQISEITDDSGDQVAANVYDKINFPSKLQQFQQTLSRHRFSLQSQSPFGRELSISSRGRLEIVALQKGFKTVYIALKS